MVEIAVRYLHFVSLLALVAAVFGQAFFIRRSMARAEIVRLQKLDIAYAVSTVLVLGSGFLQWFAIGKPAEFYSNNGIFVAKILTFLVVGILSAYPSIFLGKKRKGDPGDEVGVPPLVIWSVRAELILLFSMPLMALLVARGFGYSPD